MRIEETISIDAPAEEIWAIVTDPAQYPNFADSITRWEPEDEKKDRGLGARYSMRMRAGSAEVGGLVEVVEWDEGCDMAWNSVTGIDQRGRWRLRAQEDGTTKVTPPARLPGPGRPARHDFRPGVRAHRFAGTCGGRWRTSRR